jgi:hypothetical protein
VADRVAEIRAALRRDPGLALLVIALVAAAALYLPTIGYGLTNYDDPWLVRDNVVVRDATWANVHTILFDLDSPQRFILSPEYLPVRDLSMMLDYAVWGDSYGGFHATNVALYLAAIALWFCALGALGIDRTVAGVAVLLWALHPTHAESVSWLAERKGLLAAVFAAAAVLGYARWRRGGRGARWLVLAAACAVLAVWSKAPAAFAIATIAPLELVLPRVAGEASRRRAMIGIAVVGACAAAAFVPVLVLAARAQVVGATAEHGRVATALAVHGLYIELAALARPNAIVYPIETDGPAALEIAVGAIALAVVLATLAVRRVPVAVRAGAIIWLVCWLPVSHLVLPLQMVVAADRYALFTTLGGSLAVAGALFAIRDRRGRAGLIAAIAVASGLRALDARASWQSDAALWARATESAPRDAAAWSEYADAVDDPELAMQITDDGIAHVDSPKLWLRKALVLQTTGHAADARPWFQRAAEAGEPVAMADLASLLLDAGDAAGALAWGTAAVAAAPNTAHAHRTLGRAALATGDRERARRELERAVELEPRNPLNGELLRGVSVSAGSAIDH